jgi:integrase
MHIRQLPSVRWRYFVQHEGQKVSGTADTRGKAQQAGAEALLRMGIVPTMSTVTVGELLEAHLTEHDYAATTRQDFERIVVRLPEHVTSVRVQDVQPVMVQGWYRLLAGDGWSPHRIGKVHTLLSSAWNRARRYGWANRNVMRDVDKPRVAEADVRPPTQAEVRAILDAATGPVRLYLRLAAVTGARRGEAVGLQWGDVAVDVGEVSFRRSVAHTAGSTGPVVSHGKTGKKGHRVVALDADTVEALRQHRVEQVGMALRAGLPAPLWVFSHDAGVSPWRGDYITREFARTCARAGVTGVRLHDLRHYMATAMLSGGVPVSVVQHRLGHSTAAVTLKVYSHYVRAVDVDAASGLGKALG